MIASRRSFISMSVALCGGLCLCAVPRVFADGVEGKFKVKVEPDDDARKAGEKEYDDTLTITANKFISEAGKKHGFGETSYDEDTRRFGPATFTAEATSDKEGKAKWSGTVTVNEISGDMVWTKKDGTELRFSFKGSKS